MIRSALNFCRHVATAASVLLASVLLAPAAHASGSSM
ncbi:MAG: conjugal transfer protein TrbC, partial [Mesorhizobium sp.]